MLPIEGNSAGKQRVRYLMRWTTGGFYASLQV